MRKYPWEPMHKSIKVMQKMLLTAGGNLDMQGPNSIMNLTPTLWVDFINADPQNSHSVWLIYKEYARAVEDFIDWMADNGYGCEPEMKATALLSKEEFLKQYPVDLQEDAVSLHREMKKAIDVMDKGKTEDVESLGSGLPSLLYYIRAANTSGVTAKGTHQITVLFKNAHQPRLWLSAILEGMRLSYRNGRTARRCAAPDCGKYFLPYLRRLDQRYHSPSCQDRHYKRMYRKSH